MGGFLLDFLYNRTMAEGEEKANPNPKTPEGPKVKMDPDLAGMNFGSAAQNMFGGDNDAILEEPQDIDRPVRVHPLLDRLLDELGKKNK